MLNWFGEGKTLELEYDMTDAEHATALESCAPALRFVQGQKVERSDELFVLEMILWALSEHAKLNRDKLVTGLTFNDLFNSYFRGLSDEETTA